MNGQWSFKMVTISLVRQALSVCGEGRSLRELFTVYYKADRCPEEVSQKYTAVASKYTPQTETVGTLGCISVAWKSRSGNSSELRRRITGLCSRTDCTCCRGWTRWNVVHMLDGWYLLTGSIHCFEDLLRCWLLFLIEEEVIEILGSVWADELLQIILIVILTLSSSSF